MALIECPKCQKRISSKAKECQHCKVSLVGSIESLAKISHIQQSNRLMNHSLIFLSLFIAGAVAWFWGGEQAQGVQAIVAVSCFVVGFIGYFITRVRLVLHKRKSV